MSTRLTSLSLHSLLRVRKYLSFVAENMTIWWCGVLNLEQNDPFDDGELTLALISPRHQPLPHKSSSDELNRVILHQLHVYTLLLSGFQVLIFYSLLTPFHYLSCFRASVLCIIVAIAVLIVCQCLSAKWVLCQLGYKGNNNMSLKGTGNLGHPLGSNGPPSFQLLWVNQKCLHGCWWLCAVWCLQPPADTVFDNEYQTYFVIATFSLTG